MRITAIKLIPVLIILCLGACSDEEDPLANVVASPSPSISPTPTLPITPTPIVTTTPWPQPCSDSWGHFVVISGLAKNDSIAINWNPEWAGGVSNKRFENGTHDGFFFGFCPEPGGDYPVWSVEVIDSSAYNCWSKTWGANAYIVCKAKPQIIPTPSASYTPSQLPCTRLLSTIEVIGLGEGDDILLSLNPQWGESNPEASIGNGKHSFSNSYCPEPDGSYPPIEMSTSNAYGYACTVINGIEDNEYQVVCTR